jgi:hypothetical protein
MLCRGDEQLLPSHYRQYGQREHNDIEVNFTCDDRLTWPFTLLFRVTTSLNLANNPINRLDYRVVLLLQPTGTTSISESVRYERRGSLTR